MVLTWIEGGIEASSRGNACLDPLHGFDDVGARLLEDDQQDAALAVLPSGEQAVLRAVDGAADVAHPDGRAVTIGQHDVFVLACARKLVVVVDGVGFVLAVDAALGSVDGGAHQQVAHILQGHPHGGEFVGLGLHPHGALLLAADHHLCHAGNLRDLLRQHVLSVVVGLDQRQCVRLRRQDHDRRVGRVHLPVGRRSRHDLRQLPAGGLDRRLDVAGRAIDVAIRGRTAPSRSCCPGRSPR